MRAAAVFETFVCLTQVDIERKSAGGSDHDVVRAIDFDGQHAVHFAAALAVSEVEMAGQHADDAAFGAKRQIFPPSDRVRRR